jgi:cation transport ATPase
MHDHLNRLPQIIRTGKNVRRIMFQCFGTWTVTNIVGLALVLTGVIGPVGAAAYNFLTDFVPILNALRASKIK